MSELEQKFRSFLSRHPEVVAAKDMLNIRALARSFVTEEGIGAGKIEAAVAMIRRTEIVAPGQSTSKDILTGIRISMKDGIVILDYKRSREIVENLKLTVSEVDYDRNETLKIVVGSHTVKIIVDSVNSEMVKEKLGEETLRHEDSSVSETSLLFPASAHDEKGIVSYVTSQLVLNGVNIKEILTCTPELIVYVDEKQSLKAYEVFKRIKS